MYRKLKVPCFNIFKAEQIITIIMASINRIVVMRLFIKKYRWFGFEENVRFLILPSMSRMCFYKKFIKTVIF